MTENKTTLISIAIDPTPTPEGNVFLTITGYQSDPITREATPDAALAAYDKLIETATREGRGLLDHTELVRRRPEIVELLEQIKHGGGDGNGPDAA